jgi:hypothetical protein
MKTKTHFFPIMALVFPFAATGKAQQDIPPGVKYKPAPDPVNAAAKLKLEGALANGAAFPKELFGENNLIWCGPTLWKFLKPSADKTLLEAQILTGNLPLPDGVIVTEGGGMRNEQEKRSFWNRDFATVSLIHVLITLQQTGSCRASRSQFCASSSSPGYA